MNVLNSLPAELQFQILSSLSISDCVNFASTSKENENIVFDTKSGIWKIFADRLGISKEQRDRFNQPIAPFKTKTIKPSRVKKIIGKAKSLMSNKRTPSKPLEVEQCTSLIKACGPDSRYPNIIVNYLRHAKSEGLDNFFDAPLEIILLTKKLALNPSPKAVDKGLKNMMGIALSSNSQKEISLFETWIPYVLPQLEDQEKITKLYARAITYHLPFETVNKMETCRPCNKNDIRVRTAILTRAKKDPKFNQYASNHAIR